MQRVLVVGNGGSGKSWLASRLGSVLGVPVHRLDEAVFEPDWTRRGSGERAAIEAAWTAGPAWVIDDNGLATLPVRLEHAECVVVLDTPVWRCLARILRRRLRRREPARPGVAGAERLRPRYLLYVATYPWRMRPRVLDALRGFDGEIVLFGDQAEVEDFLARRPPR